MLKIHERVLFCNPRNFLKMNFLGRMQAHFLIKLKMDTTRETKDGCYKRKWNVWEGISSYIEKLTKIFPVRIFKNRKK